VPVAPRLATSGPPIAVPSGVETSTIALRAESTAGRLAGVVADWNCKRYLECDPRGGPSSVRFSRIRAQFAPPIAAEAGVDQALLLHFFGSKMELFLEVVDLPVDPKRPLL
jgi:hypothetical protein